jgi:hypothetical protein
VRWMRRGLKEVINMVSENKPIRFRLVYQSFIANF